MKNLKYVFFLALLGISFLAGSAWKSQDNSSNRDQEGLLTESNDLTSEKQSNNVKQEVKVISNTEVATIDLFESAAPQVVYINTSKRQRDYWSRNVYEIPSGSGSGFIWDKEGHIITNYHVVQGASSIEVVMADQTSYEAVQVGYAEDKDLAVLKINAKRSSLDPLPIGSSDDLKVGQSVYAIGNPFGLDHTLTTGIVSALGREIESVSGVPIKDCIQTDAAINPGNSGGPLLDSQGRLIGVNTAIYSPSGAYAGIGFSIPVDILKWVVPDLIQYGKIQRPILGVQLAHPNQLKGIDISGALVLNVEPGGPASKAGVLSTKRDRYGSIVLGDIIIGIDQNKISSYNDLVLTLEKYKPGDDIQLVVLREEEEKSLNLKLGS